MMLLPAPADNSPWAQFAEAHRYTFHLDWAQEVKQVSYPTTTALIYLTNEAQESWRQKENRR